MLYISRSVKKQPPRHPQPDPPENVVALSRYRAQLGRGRRNRRIDELFAKPDPARAIRALPPDEFFYVISEIGAGDAIHVLSHGTPEQIQAVLDFALWDRDQISLERLDEWMGALAGAPHAAIGAWLQGLDVELLALLVRKRTTVYDVSLEEPPEDSEEPLWSTPDRLFVLLLHGEGEGPKAVVRLVDALYRTDRDFARRVLVGARAELDADLEELAFRWRSGRMADLGFVDFYEALEVYREIDPSLVRIEVPSASTVRSPNDRPDDGSLRVPSALAERLAGSSPFARAIGAISSPEELSNVHCALVALCNRVLSADRISPGDEQAVAPVLVRVAATLDLAVEFLARGSEERAVEAVRGVPMLRLFQLGTSVVGKVKKLALALTRGTPFAKMTPPLSLFEPDDDAILDPLTRLRPLFPKRLDDPPAPGERPFASLADVAIAGAAVARAGAALKLVIALGVRPLDLTTEALAAARVSREALDTAVLARTALLPVLLGANPGIFRPVPRTAVTNFKQRFNDLSEVSATVEKILLDVVRDGTLTPAVQAVAARWAATLVPLEPVITDEGLT